MSGKQRKLELSVPQIVGSALAALTAAVAASYLGTAGTLIGAAMMSLASTVVADVYTHYLKRTGDKVKQHTVIAWRGQSGDAKAGGRRRWARVGMAAALVFTVSMGSILIYELIADRTVADQVAGRTREEAGKGQGKKDRRDGRAVGEPRHERPVTRLPSPTPSPGPSTGAVATPTPSGSAVVTPTPSGGGTGSAEPSPPSTPDPTPSDTPTSVLSPSPPSETPHPPSQERRSR
ncbi:hypothetical protein ACIBIZ_34120 [Nonomuraea spiralis]|uniref:Uncharacterized protein n=1 Tax=Nonomuraea spiralis TaxID=46182 RepID=A0ABV5IB78_9ACTN|nr:MULTISPECIES: hypothetical protein [Nonomuraea]GGS81381.1 hypothetical protein GCM10010176_026190 [Nonomuraea spiralis]